MNMENGTPPQERLLEVRNLVKYYPVTAGVLRRKVGDVKAVDDISFDIQTGETLGLVGESGCGKTTTGRCILQLHEITSGKVLFQGRDLVQTKGEALRRMRRHMQLIFQDPFASLDPRMTAGDIIGEPLRVHDIARGKEYRRQVAELLSMVELTPSVSNRYPHEFSGGQRQRLGIARALAVRPAFIVCDEPVSALDVSIQAQIITLLMRLRKEFNLTYLFIAHDLAVVRNISDPGGGDVPGQDHGDHHQRPAVRQPAASVHHFAAVGGAHSRSRRGPYPGAHHSQGRRSQSHESAQRLSVPHPLPARHRHLPDQGSRAQVLRPRPLDRLPPGGVRRRRRVIEPRHTA